MRNLKRVLSLALASAMLLGMMVMGAGAADTKKPLTDLDKITNKEAVNLMVDLGIITGKPDGSYGPTETVDRATMSTLIFRVLMATSDASGFVGVTSPLTDVKGHWAEGYINYCYSMNIVAGTGANAYAPNDKVAVVSAAKMLLVALGYDASLSKYQNDSMWSVNIMRDAQAAGLLNGIDQKSTDELTRDNAAQMIYNAMFANTVTPDTERDQGVLYLKKYDPKATTLGQETYKLFKGTAVVKGINSDGTIISDLSSSVVYKADLEKLTATSEMLGNTVNVYYKSSYKVVSGAVVEETYSKMYSTNATPAASKVVSTTMDGTKLADMIDKTNKKYVGDLETAANILYFKNGDDVTATYKNNISAFDTAFAKAGIIIELINNDTDALIDVVKVTEKKVVTLTGDTSTKDVTGADTQVKVPGIINAFTSDNTVKTVIGYEGLKKDDVVLTYKVGTLTYIEKAATIEGVVTSRNSAGQLKVDGTFYGKSGLTTFDPTAIDFENTYTFYLDNSKSIVKAVQKTDNVSSSYVFVTETGWVKATGGVGNAAGYAQARILNMDGTTEVVTVSKVGTVKVTEDGAASTVDVDDIPGSFYTFKTDSDGKYELTVATAKDGVSRADANQVGITGGTAKFDDRNVGNSATVFVVMSGTADKPVYTAYTGVANLPSMTLAAGTTAANSELLIKGGLVTHAFLSVVGGVISGEVGEYFYVMPKTAGGTAYDFEIVPKNGNVPEHKTVKAIVNGAEDTAAKIDSSIAITGGGSLTAGKLYTVEKKDVNGIITEVKAVTTGTAAGNIITGVKISGDTLIAGNNNEIVTVNSDTDVFFITADGVSTINYSDIQTDKNDKVMIAKKDTKGVAEIVYIIEVVSKDATATTTVSATIGGTDVASSSITAPSWSAAAGTIDAPKVGNVSIEIATADKDKAFTFTLNSTDPEATVALYTGTIPTTGVETQSAATLVFRVAAEDGSTVLYYQVNLSITNA